MIYRKRAYENLFLTDLAPNFNTQGIVSQHLVTLLRISSIKGIFFDSCEFFRNPIF